MTFDVQFIITIVLACDKAKRGERTTSPTQTCSAGRMYLSQSASQQWYKRVISTKELETCKGCHHRQHYAGTCLGPGSVGSSVRTSSGTNIPVSISTRMMQRWTRADCRHKVLSYVYLDTWTWETWYKMEKVGIEKFRSGVESGILASTISEHRNLAHLHDV